LKILVLIANPCVNDARVIREAEVLAEAGHEVVVYAAWRAGLPPEETRGRVLYRRRPTRALDAVERISQDKGSRTAEEPHLRPAWRWSLIDLYMATRGATRWLRPFIREAITPTAIDLMRNAYYFRGAVDEKPDVVHAHELATMLAGSRIARKTGAKLVYDSHELETGRNGIWGAWELWLRGRAERWLIRRADRVITVSDSIGDICDRTADNHSECSRDCAATSIRLVRKPPQPAWTSARNTARGVRRQPDAQPRSRAMRRKPTSCPGGAHRRRRTA
jgi:hypothetical protein